ncbi:NETI protein [Bacillus oleivorans]|uniref:NETI protein n=1 Tax=Bacillus oleivorans TaxID=1448271 RepID=A0A285CTS4_9BACI|nr:NETI motif-containing protein [Bacillus oleivorans]SNX70970.1 NETI protein [Bacillus oleivorans]
MSKAPKKKWFVVLENETVDDCLKRMAAEGYVPIRRMEKPVFEETIENGNKVVKPVNQEIQFQGELTSDE